MALFDNLNILGQDLTDPANAALEWWDQLTALGYDVSNMSLRDRNEALLKAGIQTGTEMASMSAAGLGGLATWGMTGSLDRGVQAIETASQLIPTYEADTEQAQTAYRLMETIDQPIEAGAKAAGRGMLELTESPELAAMTETALAMFVGPKGSRSGRGSFELDTAKRMERNDVPMNEIRQETGWSQTPYGDWNREISDTGTGKIAKPLLSSRRSNWDKPDEMETTLGEFMDHPELFEEYPELARYPVHIQHMGEGESNRGSFMPPATPLWEDNWVGLKPKIKLNKNLSEAEMRKTLLHEVQHAIQDIEVWDVGTNPELGTARNLVATNLRKIIDRHRRKKDNNRTQREIDNDDQLYRRALSQWKQLDEMSDFEIYERTFGEGQARMTASRADQTLKQRYGNDTSLFPIRTPVGGVVGKLDEWFFPSKESTGLFDEAGSKDNTTWYRGEHSDPAKDGYRHSRLMPTFTDDPAVASVYAESPNDTRAGHKGDQGRIYPVKANYDNAVTFGEPDDPFIDFTDLANKIGRDKAKQVFLDEGQHLDNQSRAPEVLAEYDVSDYDQLPDKAWDELYIDSYPIMDNAILQQAVQEAGYDAIISYGTTHSSTGDAWTKTARELRVFDDNKVKSQFDQSSSTKLVDERAERMTTSEWAKGHSISQVVYHGTGGGQPAAFETGRAGMVYFAEDPALANQFAFDTGTVGQYRVRYKKLFDMVDNPEHKQRAIDLFNAEGGWQSRAESDGYTSPEQWWDDMGGEGRRNDYLYDEGDLDWEILDNPETDIMYDLLNEGYDAFRFTDNDGTPAIGTHIPENIRSINAKFDEPSGSRLMGSIDEFEASPKVTATDPDMMISARYPTGAGRLEDPQQSLLLSDVASMTEGTLNKNLRAVAQYPGMKVRKNAKPERVMAEFMELTRSNLQRVFEEMPEDMRDASKQWYDGANRIRKGLAEHYNIAPEAASGVIAAMSPQNPWDNNLAAAERVIDTFKNQQSTLFTPEMEQAYKVRAEKGETPWDKDNLIDKIRGKKLNQLTNIKEKAAWVRLYDEGHNSTQYHVWSPQGKRTGIAMNESGTPSKFSWGDFTTVGNAISIIENPSVHNISEKLGIYHKVRNFYNNLENPNAMLPFYTSDTHNVSAALLSPLGGSAIEVSHSFGKGKGQSGSDITGHRGTYPLYHDVGGVVAKENNLLPREFQSIVWESIRNIFTNKSAALKKEANQIWVDYAKGRLTMQQAQDRIIEASGGFKTPTWAE